MIRFDDRSLVVVGGGSGLGWAAAELAVGLGAKVTVVDVNPATANAVVRLGSAARFVAADATDPNAVERMFTEAVAAQHGLDSVFVTVGGARLGPLAAMISTRGRPRSISTSRAPMSCAARRCRISNRADAARS